MVKKTPGPKWKRPQFEEAYDSYRERYKDEVHGLYDDLEQTTGLDLIQAALSYGLTSDQIKAAIKEGERKGRRKCGDPENKPPWEADSIWTCIGRYQDGELRDAIHHSEGWRDYIEDNISIPNRHTMRRMWDAYWRCSRGSARLDYRRQNPEFEAFLVTEFGYIPVGQHEEPGRPPGGTN